MFCPISINYNFFIFYTKNKYWLVIKLFKINNFYLILFLFNIIISILFYVYYLVTIFYNILKLSIYTLLITSVDYNFIFKIRFKRKGGWFYIRNYWPFLLTFRFGYGHPMRFVFSKVWFRIYKKYLSYHVLLILGHNLYNLQQLSFNIRAIRPINMYSRRGIRWGRQFFLKRKGKDSQYTKLKSKIF